MILGVLSLVVSITTLTNFQNSLESIFSSKKQTNAVMLKTVFIFYLVLRIGVSHWAVIIANTDDSSKDDGQSNMITWLLLVAKNAKAIITSNIVFP